MKKRALRLGLMAIGMIVASLFTAAPAFANYSIQNTSPNLQGAFPGSSHCTDVNGGSWPRNGHLHYCANTGHKPVGQGGYYDYSYGQDFYTPLQNKIHNYARILIDDPASNVQVVIFENVEEEALYSWDQAKYPGQAGFNSWFQKRCVAVAQASQAGLTFSPSSAYPETLGSPSKPVIWLYAYLPGSVNDCSNWDFTKVYKVPNRGHIALHEAGHAFDFLLWFTATPPTSQFGLMSLSGQQPPQPSNGGYQGYTNVYEVDRTFCQTLPATCAASSFSSSTTAYFFGLGTMQTDRFQELFAEDFAVISEFESGDTNSGLPIADQNIRKTPGWSRAYWTCTWDYVKFLYDQPTAPVYPNNFNDYRNQGGQNCRDKLPGLAQPVEP